ncbi:MAG TPA: hypothetical protein VHO90_07345 [Bacteroidales bacterium]|jgi:hypothetical protein|nr:hypothetical protein [Bacteroidales bacterium]
MTDKQENKLRMYLTVSAVCESNVEVWQDNDSFKLAFEQFCQKIPMIEKLRDIQEIENAGLKAAGNNITRIRFSRNRIKAASENLRKLFHDTDNFIYNKLDKEILDFREDAPDFFYQFNAARIMLYPVSFKERKTSIPVVEN